MTPDKDKFNELAAQVEAAETIRAVFMAYVAAGFNEAQSMQIVLTVLAASIRNNAGAGPVS